MSWEEQICSPVGARAVSTVQQRSIILAWLVWQASADEARNSRSVPGGNFESLGERDAY